MFYVSGNTDGWQVCPSLKRRKQHEYCKHHLESL